MKYTYRRGGDKFRGVPADVAARELERIRKEAGRLHTESVVEAARPEKAPLHPVFEWNDGDAAHQYRLLQARTFIRNVVVIRTKDAEPEPLFVHVVLESEGEEGSTEQYYQSSRVIINNPTELQAALDQSRLRLQSAQKSLSDLERIAKGSKHIKLVRSAVKHVQRAAGVLDRVAGD